VVTQHLTDLGSAGPFKVARETCGEDGQPLLLGGDEVPVDANGLEDHQNFHGFQGRSRRGVQTFLNFTSLNIIIIVSREWYLMFATERTSKDSLLKYLLRCCHFQGNLI
jgi:hypothetical protein